MHEHPSLTSLNVGNTLAVKNRNRIHNEGLAAILQAVATSRMQPSLLQELYLSNCSITAKGLHMFGALPDAGVQLHLAVLDLSHNDLGSETPALIASVMPTLISLNLANTKMGNKGAYLLAQQLKEAQRVNKQHIMRVLDLSSNKVGSQGFSKLLSRLKKSMALHSLNFSHNDLADSSEKLPSLEKFLHRNESC